MVMVIIIYYDLGRRDDVEQCCQRHAVSPLRRLPLSVVANCSAVTLTIRYPRAYQKQVNTDDSL